MVPELEEFLTSDEIVDADDVTMSVRPGERLSVVSMFTCSNPSPDAFEIPLVVGCALTGEAVVGTDLANAVPLSFLTLQLPLKINNIS